MADLTLDCVLSATGGRLSGAAAPAFLRGVSTDTRTLKPGALFVGARRASGSTDTTSSPAPSPAERVRHSSRRRSRLRGP